MTTRHDPQQAADEQELVTLGAHIAEVALKAVGKELEKLPPEEAGPLTVILLGVYAFADMLKSGMLHLQTADPDPIRARRQCAQVLAFLSQDVEPPASTSRFVN